MARHVINAVSSAKIKKSTGSGLHFTSSRGLGSANRAMENLGKYGTMNPSAEQQMDYAATDYAFGLEQTSADKAMAFEKNMSDTAHQREVADLKAAGLNPVLSAGGNGASIAPGQTANADTTTAQQEMKNQKEMNKYAADKSYKANKYAVDQNIKFNKWATKYNGAVSDLVSARSLQAAETQAAAARYSADVSYAGAKLSADTQMKLGQLNYDLGKYKIDHGKVEASGKVLGSGFTFSGSEAQYKAFLKALSNKDAEALGKFVGKNVLQFTSPTKFFKGLLGK